MKIIFEFIEIVFFVTIVQPALWCIIIGSVIDKMFPKFVEEQRKALELDPNMSKAEIEAEMNGRNNYYAGAGLG